MKKQYIYPVVETMPVQAVAGIMKTSIDPAADPASQTSTGRGLGRFIGW